MAKYLNVLRKRAGERKLLSEIDANPKVAKNGKLGVLTAIMHLAPGNMSGFEVCPKRSPGCSAACLHFAGSPAYMAVKTQARIRKTQLLFRDRNLFMNMLALEIGEHILESHKRNVDPAFRLNGTSDIVWEKKNFILWPETSNKLLKLGAEFNASGLSLPEMFPETMFYDYTAIPGRTPSKNYHLTFSAKEQNMNATTREMQAGRNIAVVFRTAQLPDRFMGRPVIDGDEHDYRPADPKGVVVGLKAKGARGRQDLTGFVYPVNASAESDTELIVA